jgi:ABC-type branched-subunit amino acid transport system ATPase component
MTSMLEIAGLRAGYGRLEILQGVDMTVSANEVVGIIGPNGAGKSTLVKTVFGYAQIFDGRIAFEGKSVIGLSPDKVMRLGIGYVGQAGGIFPDMTVRENLILGGYTLRDRRAVTTAIDRVLDRFPLFRERSSQRAGSLSGGQQRLLAIARTLMVNPRLLILDEPSAALSPVAIDEVYEQLDRLNRDGVTLLIVEQNVETILAAAQRILVLDMGCNAFGGSAAELRASDRIRRLYLGEAASV